jgi:hypothetical protein
MTKPSVFVKKILLFFKIMFSRKKTVLNRFFERYIMLTFIYCR